jgi:hypothetical protein
MPTSGPTTSTVDRPAAAGTQPAAWDAPPGYIRFTTGGLTFVSRPVDQEWIVAAADHLDFGTGPSTQPGDLFARLSEKRNLLLSTMLKDLPTLRPSQIEALIDDNLLPMFQQLSTLKSKPVYLVTPIGPLKTALRQGWTHSQVKLLELTDRVEFDRNVGLSPEGQVRESLVGAVFDELQDPQERARLLHRYVLSTQSQMRTSVAMRATTAAVVQTADFIAREALAGLPDGEDQVWLPVGLAHVLAAKYVSVYHGSPFREFMEQLVTGRAGQSTNAAQIDLLKPLPTNALRPEAVAPYLDARRRKVIAVMYFWLREAGEKKVMPMITAVERLRPADGQTLVEAIRNESGVDLSTALQPR